MAVKTFPIGPLETNAYVVYNQKDAILIDAGGDIRGGLVNIKNFLEKNELDLKAIIITHMHFDHILGVADMRMAYPQVNVYGCQADDFILQASFGSNNWGMPPVKKFDYEEILAGTHKFGSLTCQVFNTPGHSPGSISIYFPEEHAVFTGDLLFYRSIGRTDLPGSNHMHLIESLQKNIYSLPAETIAYPGHGPETLVGDEKRLNPFVKG